MVFRDCRLLAVFVTIFAASGHGYAFADTPAPATQPAVNIVLTACDSKFDVIPSSPTDIKVVFGKRFMIPLQKGLGPGEFKASTEVEYGFVPADKSIFFAIQAYDISVPPDSVTAEQLVPAATAQVRQRWGADLPADAAIEMHPNPKVLLELGYAMHSCHGTISLVDRYMKVGKQLMRVTVIPMSQSLTVDQFADLNDRAQETSLKLIQSAKPFNEQMLKAALKPQQPVAQALPRPAVAQNNVPGAAPGFGNGKTPKPSGADLQNHRAELALAQADKLKADGKDTAAYDRYKFIVKEYAKTPSADSARQAITAYEADTEFMAKYNGPTSQPSVSHDQKATPDTDSSKAKALLSLAESYAAVGEIELANQKYQSIIDQFPKTPEAAIAKQKLAGE